MATLLLQVAGQAVGGALLGGFGGIIGRAAGALAGYAIDSALFGKTITTKGPRLESLSVQSSSEGAPMPRIYGRARLAGQVIWATDFEEVKKTKTEGGKGAPTAKTTTYKYFANFAVALSEGPVSRIGRIWADGKPLDLSKITYRTYLGTPDQEPDALIVAKQPDGLTPAYRDTAYVVFERLPLADFGNRLPQLTFEVIRVIGNLERHIPAVTVIPGASEFAYSDGLVTRTGSFGKTVADNRHNGVAETDWTASIDELQAVCPNLKSVALVVAWFGTDLRADQCEILPGVESRNRETRGATWTVAGADRATAYLVSQVDQRPAYGGSPDDVAVLKALSDLKARGLKVVFYPFVMMDIPAENGLADPYGSAEQAPYPWRGRITCDPAPGQPGSPDKTVAIAATIDAFAGSAGPDDFTVEYNRVTYSGPDEWRYRRFILHYAHLVTLAGGVDAFLIGSELRALTQLRSDAATYPFVSALKTLAHDVRTVVGSDTKLSYAADWSEYFGHQPSDGSGDVYFHLDPLWADPAIDFIGIDNYMPLADWRDGDHADRAFARSVYDRTYLQGNIAGGEGYDWYYASPADRVAGARTPITDGAYGKPWVYRYKDLKAWWENLHFDRPGGVEAPVATAWVPQSKPIWFTEIGCPAVDHAANQPNVFYDPKSSESFLPHFSKGRRDDRMQRSFLEAVYGYWTPGGAGYQSQNNPVSAVYGSAMVDPQTIHAWTWDARPFPSFPGLLDVWADGGNWQLGHWLTGRLGGLPLAEFLAAFLADFGFDGHRIENISEVVDGYVVPGPASARAILEPLAGTFRFTAIDTGIEIRIAGNDRATEAAVLAADLVVPARDGVRLKITRSQETELPFELRLGFFDMSRDYERSAISTRRSVGESRRVDGTDLAVIASPDRMAGVVETWLHDIWAGRDRFQFALPPSYLPIEAGDIVELSGTDRSYLLLVERVEDTGARMIEARSIDPMALRPMAQLPVSARPPALPAVYGPPGVVFLDLPVLASDQPHHRPYVALYADPWYGAAAIWRSNSGAGYDLVDTVDETSVIGALAAPLAPGPVGRWDRHNTLIVELVGGALQSVEPVDVFAGRNALAIEAENGAWEVLQFASATLLGSNTYRLDELLRGQLGTEDAMAAGSMTGAKAVLIDETLSLMALSQNELSVPLTYRIGPDSVDVGDAAMAEHVFSAGGRGLRPYSPVHLRARRDSGTGDVTFDWIRRTRTDGDSWEATEVPLGEEAERYQLDILNETAIARSATVTAPTFAYSSADQQTDFGALQSSYRVRVAQLSNYTAGISRTETLTP